VTRLGASVTVIIATFNRAALLDECLEHLRFQNFLPGDEVIVVDNGSTDDTRGIVARRQAFFPVPMHLLRETVPGKSRAISRAVTFANGDILAFTDDDVNVSGDWLEVIRGAMADPAVALVGGRVTPRWQAGVPRWIQEARDRHPRLGAPLALLDYGSQDMDLGARTALGANLAVRWEVFTRVGGFPTHLGKLRGTLLSGEDAEICRLVQSAGFRAIYLPRASVAHWVPVHRARISYFLRWFYWSGITHALMDSPKPGGHQRSIRGLPLYLVARAGRASTAVLAALARGNRIPALNAAVEVAFALGYAAGCWRLTRRVTARAVSTAPEAA
jgi:glycosyltransferase involved in cell wall biosynthesis